MKRVGNGWSERALADGTGVRKAAGVRRAILAWALAASLLAVSATGASAVIVTLKGGKAVSYQPLKAPEGLSALSVRPLDAGSNLTYHGGPVMTSNTNYAFYWSPSGASAYPAGYRSGIDQYFEDLAHDSGGLQNVDSVALQYTNGKGEPVAYDSHFAGAILDTNPYPENGCKKAPICLTDAQLQAELSSYIAAHGLPKDLAHEYFMLTPPGVADCLDAAGERCSAASTSPSYCAYHSSFASGGGVIVYASNPYLVGVEACDDGERPNESPSDEALSGISHEHNESTTDPELNAWYAASGGENGDKCRTGLPSEFGTPLGTAPNGSPYNQLVNGHEYWYQQEWSNDGSTCLQRQAPAVPSVSTLTPKTGPATGGTSVTITGTGFTGVSEVRFGATPASFVFHSGSSITAASPPQTAGEAHVTVTGPFGTSATSKLDVFKYKPKPAVTSVSPSSGSVVGGTVVTISGSGFALGAETEFKFAKGLATGVNCSSATSCTAITPAKTKAGIVQVLAVVGKAKSNKTPPGDEFTYF